MKISRIKKVVVASMLAVVSLCGFAAEPKKAQEKIGVEAELKPLNDYIIAPRESINLCGEWDYAELKGKEEKYPDPKDATKTKSRWVRPETNLNTLAWQKVTIPWAMRGLSQRDYYYFRKSVTLPKDLTNKRVLFNSEYIMDTYSLIVNGQRFEPRTTFELKWQNDITSAAKPGENEIIVEVSNNFGRRDWADSPFQHEWAVAGHWGISRPVFLEICDKVSIDEVVIQTAVTPEKIFTLKTLVTNTTDKASSIVVAASVEGEWNIKADQVEIPAKGSKEIVLEKKWDNVKLWDIEHPNLYNVDITVSSNNKVIDAYRERFGFREIKIVKHQFLLNGKPFIHRRTTHPKEDDDPRDDAFRKAILICRENGVTGMRLFGGDEQRWAKNADETGAFLTPVAPSGWGSAYKSEKFWPTFLSYQIQMVKTLRNHPSIFAWGLGNEFGTIYGGNEGGPREKGAQEKEAHCGKVIGELDPTRGWTYCGEIEVSYPAKGTVGPAPIRSYHYPISTCRDGITFPESGYWYDKGELSWHRISTKDKPSVISEGIYHGTTDQFIGMTKTGGDSIFTVEGYAKTLHYIIRSFAEGYYYSGFGGWETWVTYQNRGDKNMLNRLGALMPHFLITTRENFPNMREGEKVIRNVYCFNQLCTPYNCELIREDTFEGKVVYTETKKFLLDAGIKHREEMIIETPFVKKASKYDVKLTLKTGDRVLTDRTYTYTIFPKKTTIDVAGETALYASSNSVLRAMKFANGIFNTAKDAVASGAKAIVVDAVMSDADGRILNDFALAGGKVLVVEANEASWSPIMGEYRRPMSFLWRRNDDKLVGMEESWMKAWMPDHTLGDASYPKPAIDTSVLWDCGLKEGLTNANILWINSGKGAWLLCQLPVLSRFAIEPAAPHVLQMVMNEFTQNLPQFNGKVVASTTGSAADLLKMFKIETSTKMPTADDVLVVDGSNGLGGDQLLAIDAHTKQKGTVLILEPNPGKDDELLAKFGLKISPIEQEKAHVWGAMRPIDKGPKWLLRKNCSGILAGFANDETFWNNPNAMETYMMKNMCGETNVWFGVSASKSIITGTLEALPNSKAEILTTPGGIAVAPYNGGRVVVVSLKFSEFAATYSQRASRLVRTILNNLGAQTVTPERVHSYQFIDLAKYMNRGLWNDPLFKKEDGTFDPVGWFGTENDMRYFPVNLCGWSMAARNYCPKEAFPTEPKNYGGIKFLLTDPDKNKGRGCLVLGTNETVRIAMPKNLKAQKFYFFGAQSGFGNSKNTKLEMKIPAVKEPVVFMGGGEHFGVYRWAASVKQGVVGWCGETIKDDQASLYQWSGVNTAAEKVVPWIELKNTSEKDEIAIIAITAELLDE